MSHAVEPSPLHRLRFTPMRDVLRGRITGRLDLRTRIDSSTVPVEAKALIKRVVRHTRLWALEKVDVADELTGHFDDGLASGERIDSLVKNFGDERQAARLIARAKRRNRSPIWQLLCALRTFGIILLAIYIGCGLIFFSGRPSMKVDYFALINSRSASLSPDQRAWPSYQQAAAQIEPANQQARRQLAIIIEATADSKHWPQLVRWVDEHDATVKLVWEASSKPGLGFIIGVDDTPARWGRPASRPLMYCQSPGINGNLDELLLADARVAITRRDAKRIVRDIDALLAMSEQLRASRTFYAGLYAIQRKDTAVTIAAEALAEVPQIFSDEALRQLAHRLAGPRVAADLIDLTGQRLFFYDIVQRIYTDNGAGDGRLTRDVLHVLPEVTGIMIDKAALFASPALTFAHSRQQVVAKYEQLMQRSESFLRRPMREVDWREMNAEWEKISEPPDCARYGPLTTVFPHLESPQITAERYLALRDGLLIAIGLEIYHQRNGDYPQSLDPLVPEILPRIPEDRITGEPLHYRLIDGKPIAYSVGVDRDDDGGRSAKRHDGSPSIWNAAIGNDPKLAETEGDWVLYPQPKPEPLDENE